MHSDTLRTHAAAMLRMLALLADLAGTRPTRAASEALGEGVGEAAHALYRLADALRAERRMGEAAAAERHGDWLSRRATPAELRRLAEQWAPPLAA